MGDIDEPVEDYETMPPMNEEMPFDLANGDHFDGKDELNPLEQGDESGKNSGIFDSKVADSVGIPELSETPNSHNSSQDMVVKDIAEMDQSHDECVSPEVDANVVADRNSESEEGLSHEKMDEINEHIESSENVFVVSDSEITGETVDEDKSSESEDIHKQPDQTVLEPSENYIENHGNDDAEPEELAVNDLHEGSEDHADHEGEHSDSDKQVKQSSSEMEMMCSESQHSEHQETENNTENEGNAEAHENEGPEAEDLVETAISEAKKAQMEHDSEIPEHDSNEPSSQLSSELEFTPADNKEPESVPSDVEQQKFTDVGPTADGNPEFDTQAVESTVEENLTEQVDQEPQHGDTPLLSDESLKYSDSGSLDTVSINPNEESSDLNGESAETKEVPEITVEESDSQNRGEPEEDNPVENSLVEFNESNDVHVGTERLLNLEESVKPLDTSNENLESSLETPNVSMEEERTLSKVYSQACETCEPVLPASCEEYEAEKVSMNEAKTTEHGTELQNIEVSSEPVEIIMPDGDAENSVPGNTTSKPEIELETIEAVPIEVPEQEIVLESESIELSKPILEEEVEQEQVFEVIEAQPEVINEQAVELEVAGPSSMEIIKLVPETENEKSEIAEVVEPSIVENDESEPNRIDEPQITSKDESLNEEAPLIEEGKQNAFSMDKNLELNGKEPNISDDELDFDTRYALFVGKVLPGHEVYYLPGNKKKVTFPKGGTLDNRHTSSPLWDASLNGMRAKSATLEAPRHTRRKLQPKPTVNDDHLFPDSVTPSKVEKALSEDDTSASNDGEGGRYDVPFMDDDAFVPKKYRSVAMEDDNSSSESDYSNERRDLIEPQHIAKMDETSPHAGRTAIDGKRNLNHRGGSRWSFGLNICGCLRKRR
ncbi:unnamed protein product [Rodentolepis nana]|uniref:Zinc finger MYM-type protein 3 n=1 Tax=Rodentolepis nana TaxID=102285 RepID=A0A0R3TMF1_RODNA|nr:unnamed protein product [Rodentolepis nana]